MKLVLFFISSSLIIVCSAQRRIIDGQKTSAVIPNVAVILHDKSRVDFTTMLKQLWAKKGAYAELLCGGAIFSSHWIITSAHCLDLNIAGRTANTVGYGGTDYYNMASYYVISKRVIHPNYAGYTGGYGEKPLILDYDIALVQFAPSYTTNLVDRANPFPPPIPDGTTVLLYGWGIYEYGQMNEDLHQIELTYLEDGGIYSKESSVIDRRVLVFKFQKQYAGVEHGDSGGPIVIKQAGITLGLDVLVSLLTGGKPNERLFYGYGPNITYFKDWIQANARDGDYRR